MSDTEPAALVELPADVLEWVDDALATARAQGYTGDRDELLALLVRAALWSQDTWLPRVLTWEQCRKRVRAEHRDEQRGLKRAQSRRSRLRMGPGSE